MEIVKINMRKLKQRYRVTITVRKNSPRKEYEYVFLTEHSDIRSLLSAFHKIEKSELIDAVKSCKDARFEFDGTDNPVSIVYDGPNGPLTGLVRSVRVSSKFGEEEVAILLDDNASNTYEILSRDVLPGELSNITEAMKTNE